MFNYVKKINTLTVGLAKILGIKFVSISRWERGKFKPNMETKKKLVALFNEIGMKLDD